MPNNNMLTTKELTLLSDLLLYEESASKKAKLYSKTLTDAKLSEQFTKLYENHKKRFNSLFDMI